MRRRRARRLLRAVYRWAMSRLPPRLTAGCVVFRHDPRGRRRYLLLRAYDYWDFPKGRVEAGEEPKAAAVREVEEETTLTGLRFPHGEAFHETARYAGNKVARYYLAETDEEEVSLPVSPELGRPEHHEFRWVDVEEARSLVRPRVRAALEWAEAQLGAGSR